MDLSRAFFFPPAGTNCVLDVQKMEEILLRVSVVVFKPRQIFNTLP